jgi:flavin reductase (DIM6/NTAB) family NADH-FMN oxidoreductase RutF
MHKIVDLKVMYFGTPVVLIGTRNPDGTGNIAPMSSAWWLGQTAMLGLGNSNQTTANLLRERECVLNLPSADLVAAVDSIALLTGARTFPQTKADRGYRFESDKFAAAGLTEQSSDLVSAPRIAECPIQLECRLLAHAPLLGGGASATTFQVEAIRAHIDESLILPGTSYVDPVGWDPLTMKFCEFFGRSEQIYPSRLARGWRMPHRAMPVDGPSGAVREGATGRG